MRVLRTNMKDMDNVNLKVFDNDEKLIAKGHYNIATNFAHITTIPSNQKLEDEIVEGIENHTLRLN